jgi:hypothetical protein
MKIPKLITKFISKKKTSPKYGDVFAVSMGDYAGQMLVFIKQTKDDLFFLSIPKMENRQMPIEKFDFGVEHGIIEYVERLPKSVRDITRAQFSQNETEN